MNEIGVGVAVKDDALRRVLSAFVLVLDILMLTCLIGWLLLSVPRYLSIFSEMGVALPAMTKLVIRVSQLGFALLIPWAALVGGLIAVEVLWKNRIGAAILYFAMFLLTAAMGVLSFLAIRLPLSSLLESVQK